MKFSVLMSVYKNEKAEYLVTALQSIFKQTLPANEIVLVEDGLLTSELYAVIEKYADKLKIVPLKQNVGLGKALNEGLQACTSELVARMDTDDIAVPERFALQIQEFINAPELALCGGQIREFDGDANNVLGYRKVPCMEAEIKQFAKKRNPFNHMTVMFKKSAVQAAGSYQHMPYFEDYWLWVRMIQQGYKVKNIDKVLVNARTGRDMIARRGGWRYLKCELCFMRTLYKYHFLNDIELISFTIAKSILRILPLTIRKYLYKLLVRQRNVYN